MNRFRVFLKNGEVIETDDPPNIILVRFPGQIKKVKLIPQGDRPTHTGENQDDPVRADLPKR